MNTGAHKLLTTISGSESNACGSIGDQTSTTPHNSLTGLQGGNATERYHLSKAQYDSLTTGNAPSSSAEFI